MTPLNGQGDIVLMTGVNGWVAPEEIVMKRSTNGDRYEDNVFEAKVTLAETVSDRSLCVIAAHRSRPSCDRLTPLSPLLSLPSCVIG
jgi:hypothetical protein